MYIIRTDKNSNELYQYFRDNYKYESGVNIINNQWDKYIIHNVNMSIGGGELEHYYYVRVAIVPNQCKICKIEKYVDKPGINIGKKIILSDKYYLYDPRTVMKLNLKIDRTYITGVLYKGDINFLEWWKNYRLPLEYPDDALDIISGTGHVNVLEWWKNSGLHLGYTTFALIWASSGGYVNVLEWWKNSGLPLKYSEDAVHYASIEGHINVLEWWKNFSLSLE